MNTSTDGAEVVVVGAGPAGSVTALLLARRGIDVLVVDRDAFPRPKPCGDCLSAAATRFLDELGLLDRVRHAGAAEIRRWDIIAPDGSVATGAFPDRPALAVERRILDAVLLDAAIEAGARFRQVRVTGLRRDGGAGRDDGRVHGVVARDVALDARLTVGADGLRSVVARALDVHRRRPRLRKVSLTAHVDLAGGSRPVASHGEMHVLDGGCVGVAPVGPGRWNVTLVVSEEHAPRLGSRGAEAFFHDWTGRVPSVRDRFHPVPGPFLASGPFDWPTRTAVAPGAALVGDAAGYYDPFTGQGIYQAMASARALVETVAPALAGHPVDGSRPGGANGPSGPVGTGALDRALHQYDVIKRRATRPTRRVQRLVEAVVSRPRLANVVLGRLGRARPAMDRLIEVTGDLQPPRSLLSPAALSSFLFPTDLEHR